MRSAIAELRTESFPRLRIGIDRPATAALVTPYVLAPFAPQEREVLNATVLPAAHAMLLEWIAAQ